MPHFTWTVWQYRAGTERVGVARGGLEILGSEFGGERGAHDKDLPD